MDGIPPGSAARSQDFVRSLERGLAVLELLADGKPRSPVEVAEATSVSLASVHRFLRTLCRLGYLARRADGYVVQVGAMALGNAYLAGLPLRRSGRPHLDALAREVGETTSLAVLDGEEVVYVATALPDRIVAASVAVGTRRPACQAAAGRILLARRPEERTSVRMAEPEARMRSIATPVRADDGSPVAALSVHGNGGSRYESDLTLLGRMAATAAAIGAELALAASS